ncbi:MAG: hypothetical protein EOO57_22670, partial [Hymenobacter sp.]
MKILVLRFSSIGDIVLTTPVVRQLVYLEIDQQPLLKVQLSEGAARHAWQLQPNKSGAQVVMQIHDEVEALGPQLAHQLAQAAAQHVRAVYVGI